MKDPRIPSSAKADTRQLAAEHLAEDLKALRHVTDRNLPTLEETARVVDEHLTRTAREGFMMKTFRSVRRRPFLATAVGMAVVAACLLAVPIPYSRTTGYEVQLRLDSSKLDPNQAAQIAAEFRKALKADNLSVSMDTGRAEYVLIARVPLSPRRTVERRAGVFARTLMAGGIDARPKVLAITERVSGSVYAAVANEVIEIRINGQGKTTAEIEEEIRTQLAAHGLPGAQVTVTQQGEQIRMQMHWEAAPGESLGTEKTINIQFDGGQQDR